MNQTRIFLFFAIGLLSFMLWNAWQHDFSLQPDKPEVVNAAGIPNSAPASTPAIHDDALINVPKQRLIYVTTDVLAIAIDSLGGNIVQAKLLKYPAQLHSTQPFVLLDNDPGKFYITQSGLVGSDIPESEQMMFSAPQSEYTLVPGQNSIAITLSWRNAQGLEVKKIITLNRDDYTIAVNYQINNKTATAWQGNFYSLIKRKEVAQHKAPFQFSTYAGAAISSPEKPFEKISFSKMQQENIDRTVNSGWIAMLQHYFVSAWIPQDQQDYRFYTKPTGDGNYAIGMLSPTLQVGAGQQQAIGAKLYIGPSISERLKAAAPHLDLAVDYGWLWFISDGIFWLMKHIYLVIGNWGWSIVLVTLLIKALFFKLSASSYRSMAGLRKLQPRLQAIKDRYGDDRQKLSQATMELYREEKVNPLGGCLPVLVQIPVFLALYWVLVESVELRQSPFILWIHDLSVKDPYYVLPLIMGLTIFIQQRLNSPPADPVQAKVIMFLPVIFTAFFLNFPAGLVLYWVVNNTLSIIQQWFITKKLEHVGLAPKQK